MVNGPLPEVVNDQGVAASRQGKDAAAIFQRAALADPNDEDYHYNLAISLFRRGDTVGAIREADAALKLKFSDNDAVELRARLNVVPAGTKLAPTSDTAFSPVERIRRTYSEAGFRQAAFQIDQMRALRMATLPPAEQVTQYTQLGQDYLAKGLLPEAEREFQLALSADQQAAAAHAGLAQVREQSGDPNGARSEALASNKWRPNVAAYLVLARLSLQSGDLAGSASDVAEALKIEPKNSAALGLRTALQARGQSVQ